MDNQKKRGGLNWRRGLWRVWIVGSIVWIGYIAAIFTEEVLPYFQMEYIDTEIDPSDFKIKLVELEEDENGNKVYHWSTTWNDEVHQVSSHRRECASLFRDGCMYVREFGRFNLTAIEGVQGYFADAFRSAAEAKNKKKLIARNNIFFALVVALLPPTIGLAIMLVLVWIVIGFAPNREPQDTP